MSTQRALEKSHWHSAVSSSICVIASIATFIMSFWAESLEQEIGFGRSILGYNRDWLVHGRWYFFAAIVVFTLFAILSFMKYKKYQPISHAKFK
ncbi:hypothetical protein EV681_4515 [Advenella incenata]|uniref:Uncharacterized protein n=1 Tax=Advenella incenata TaxID=267800 RepID=A0A4Q7V924_9BURK|nr:hypothetical protein [Advenella incenata]RZT91162.1 hypothetical protein EV681_4515 [Advenella incenata]